MVCSAVTKYSMYMYMYLSTAYMGQDFLSRAASKISSCKIHATSQLGIEQGRSFDSICIL